jgi:hypothetical protein
MDSTAFPAQDGAPGSLFQYDSLDPDVKTFRLLRILSTLASGIIQCQLTTVDFATIGEGSYNALSYEWGLNKPPFY